MARTYILAPNWTTAPPPDGPIKLGHILDDLTEFVPLNRRSVLEIPEEDKNPIDTKVLGLVGVGAGADLYFKKDKSDVLSCKRLDTMTFDPTDDYIAKSVELPEVSKYMNLRRFKDPVYMVTGLKIDREGSLQSSQSKEKGFKLDGGLNPPGAPAQVGGKAGLSTASAQGESWEDSTDFIVAFRVKKIWYHHGELRNKTHQDKAVMLDGGAHKVEDAMVLMSDDAVTLDDVFSDKSLTTETEIEDGQEVVWIVPKVDQDL